MYVCIVFELQCTVNEVPTYSTYKINLWITNPSVVTFTNIRVLPNKTNNHSYLIISMFKLHCWVHKPYSISRELQQGQNDREVFTFSDLECTYSLKPRNITHQMAKCLEICKGELLTTTGTTTIDRIFL